MSANKDFSLSYSKISSWIIPGKLSPSCRFFFVINLKERP